MISPTLNQHALSGSVEILHQALATYKDMFMGWGQAIFFSLLAISFVWEGIKYAFDKDGWREGLADFVRYLVFVSVFYTLLINNFFFLSILNTANYIGEKILGAPVDASSVLQTAVAFSDRVLQPIIGLHVWNITGISLVAIICWAAVLFTGIKLGVGIALRYVKIFIGIVLAPFFLAFSAFKPTQHVARNLIDKIVIEAVGLVGIFIIVAGFNTALNIYIKQVPENFTSIAPYSFMIGLSLLFYTLGKEIPDWVASFIGHPTNDMHHSTMVAIAATAARSAKTLASYALPLLGQAAKQSVEAAANFAKSAFSKATDSAFKQNDVKLGSISPFEHVKPSETSSSFKSDTASDLGASGNSPVAESSVNPVHSTSSTVETTSTAAKVFEPGFVADNYARMSNSPSAPVSPLTTDLANNVQKENNK